MQLPTADAPEPARAPASWPPVEGSYRIGDPDAPVAVCALTSDELLTPLAGMPGVAIAGEVQTANQGLERIVLNVTANPAIRFLLICGKESRLFRPGQSLGALVENGVDDARRIIGAEGYEPVLRTVPSQQIARFRRQVELVDWTGEQDLDTLRERVAGLAARTPGPFAGLAPDDGAAPAAPTLSAGFTPIRPGGHREPLAYDPKGYLVLSLDRAAGQIVVRHYQPDHTPAHEMRGRTAESILLGLIREDLISQLSHAGYLGAELAKAEAALRLGVRVRYEQDRPLRQDTPASDDAAASKRPAAPPRAASWDQVRSTPLGDRVDVICEVTALPEEHLIEGTFARPVAADNWGTYLRTPHVLRIRWSAATRVAMGTARDFQPGALLRTLGTLRSPDVVDAEGIAVLTHVASVQDDPQT